MNWEAVQESCQQQVTYVHLRAVGREIAFAVDSVSLVVVIGIGELLV